MSVNLFSNVISFTYQGCLTDGVSLPDGGSVRIEMNCCEIDLPKHWSTVQADNRILQVCKGLHEKGIFAILVSRDIIVRIKADILGIPAEDFTKDQAPNLDQQYSGRTTVITSDEQIGQFKCKGISPEQVYTIDKNDEHVSVNPVMNQFFIIKSENSRKKACWVDLTVFKLFPY